MGIGVRWGVLGGLLLASAPLYAALDGDAERGKRLYEGSCAGQCHARAVHKRENVRANSQPEIVAWIQRQCTRQIQKNLDTQDIEDLATYLNEAYYHYDD